MTTIRINPHRDPKSGRSYRAVYFGREFVRSFWHLRQAMDCAKRLAEISGAELQSADVICLRQAQEGPGIPGVRLEAMA